MGWNIHINSMCYSKEVSLLASVIIGTGSTINWFTYKVQAACSHAKHKLTPFFRDCTLGIGCIGMHQLFEFLSISSGNIIVYKIGLIWSISCIYFLMRSLEELVNLKLGSRVFLWIIALLSIEIFLQPMSFEGVHFYVRGHATVIWSAVWMALFIYWNAAALYCRTLMRSPANKKLLLMYLICVLDFSFFLSMMYAYSAALVQQHSLNVLSLFCTVGMQNVMTGFQVVQDSPSVWCIFASIQVVTMSFFFGAMLKHYNLDSPLRIRSVSKVTEFKLVLWDFVIWMVLFFSLPIFPGVAYKMLFK